MNADAHPYERLLSRVRAVGGGVGAVGAVALLAAAPATGEALFYGYLPAWVFWMGLSLGSLALLMLHHVTGGDWSFTAQRPLEAAALTVPLMAVLFVPLLFGIEALYEWSHPEVVAEEEMLQHKRLYLNVPFWIARQGLYFVVYTALAWALARASRRLEATREARHVRRLRALAVGGLIAHVLLLSFASTDWTMSLDWHWFSTIYPWLYLVSQVLTASCFAVLVLRALAGRPPHARVMRTKHFHDFGNLLLVLVVLWTYMMFFQYLIAWAGNVPEDIVWYVQRAADAWEVGIVVLVLLHFVVPFVLLLSRRAKRSRRVLPALAVLLLVSQGYYHLFLVLPSLPDVTWVAYVVALVAFVAFGGLWLALWAHLLLGRPPLPAYDPRHRRLLRTLETPAPS